MRKLRTDCLQRLQVADYSYVRRNERDTVFCLPFTCCTRNTYNSCCASDPSSAPFMTLAWLQGLQWFLFLFKIPLTSFSWREREKKAGKFWSPDSDQDDYQKFEKMRHMLFFTLLSLLSFRLTLDIYLECMYVRSTAYLEQQNLTSKSWSGAHFFLNLSKPSDRTKRKGETDGYFPHLCVIRSRVETVRRS